MFHASEDGEEDTVSCGEDCEKTIGLRRQSVFASTFDPENDIDGDEDKVARIVFPKTDAQRTTLIESVKNVLLFRSLDQEQLNQVLDAMFQKVVKPGDFIIRQGEDGDNFYVIESGVYNVTKGHKHIHTYTNNGTFGELALLYNKPRAASVQAVTVGKLWAMDRHTFRRILLKSALKQRKMYESLLDSVPMLKGLQTYERMNLADALVTKRFCANERIIKQGDPPDGIYFVEEGTISIRMIKQGTEVEVAKLTKGQYFGELALVTRRPRAASAVAEDGVKVAFLDGAAFQRILGHLSAVMLRDSSVYEEYFINMSRRSSYI